MVRIRFPDQAAKRKALGYLAGRFAFKSWSNGEMLVPELALADLAIEGIVFSVEGPATYEQRVPAVQILLPLRFNDGSDVPADLIADTLLELEQRFGAVSSETQTIRGLWRHEGQSYRDDLMRVFIDAPDTSESLAFVRTFKEGLKERFQQIDIWVTSYPIDVI